MFIDKTYIEDLLKNAKNTTESELNAILDKASKGLGLSHRETAALLTATTPMHTQRIFEIANQIKQNIYGNRIVMFAPLYVSDYCVNQCAYCSYNSKHRFDRRKLTMEEVRQEVALLERMGHKRIALEAGEHEGECSIDYILECITTIYQMKSEGEIRRINVNIAATTVENYRKLHSAGIGTYILFQETYHPDQYKKVHLAGPKADYAYHTTAFDRAMEGGIEDVGGGVLFGFADPLFEVMGLLLHNEHLEETFGVGFHTISVPRVCPAPSVDTSVFPYLVDDDLFEKLVAIIRIAVPFTGIILSTRESSQMRKRLLKIGISQLSAGSATGVGGYKNANQNPQFTVTDERSAFEIISELLETGYLPSFCTACYRSGRTGDRFMSLAKSGQIKNVCLPNALMTLCEYAQDYGSDAFREKVYAAVERELLGIANEVMRERTRDSIAKIKQGQHDFFV
ncbi:[FeFe] hydrogenase H-cluster radical SAM maturase HydG [Clostridia bacterium]|nr:[FeFe] hydrogenase H-cluster radical SAM maturase HydG [Clostridia bacterium]